MAADLGRLDTKAMLMEKLVKSVEVPLTDVEEAAAVHDFRAASNRNNHAMLFGAQFVSRAKECRHSRIHKHARLPGGLDQVEGRVGKHDVEKAACLDYRIVNSDPQTRPKRVCGKRDTLTVGHRHFRDADNQLLIESGE